MIDFDLCLNPYKDPIHRPAHQIPNTNQYMNVPLMIVAISTYPV
jgi:hypothetical protein